jgi:eukaryotic-like serine/threonine-protein kinase
MELWTEYEGRTIDNVFPLTKLLRPQGRSAYFLTSNGTGVPRVIRLVEPHFDEEEILARWRAVAALNHPNLLMLEKFGQVTLDGAPLLYAVMEPVEANLADVLVNQRLTLPDARQLALSLNSALDVLHTHGFVHEHIDPANIYAVGEVVKLRSDCIRECPEGHEGQELKIRDLHDFSVVLLQALTQQRTLEAAGRDLPLPAPFDSIVRKTIRGEWGAPEIAAALEPPATPMATRPEIVAVLGPAISAPPSTSATPSEFPAGPPAEASPGLMNEEAEEHAPIGIRTKQIIAVGLAIVLGLWLGWHFLSGRPAKPANATPASAPQIQAPNSRASSIPASAAAPAAQPAITSIPPAESQGQWRVIAYTYNHQDQAQHKAAIIAQAHPDLRPEVFTPTGHPPYLVALGGAINRDEAFALAERARHEGLPRDVYAQNYTGRSR